MIQNNTEQHVLRTSFSSLCWDALWIGLNKEINVEMKCYFTFDIDKVLFKHYVR